MACDIHSRFAADLLKALPRGSDPNTVCSPWSLSSALSVLSAGVDDDARREIVSALAAGTGLEDPFATLARDASALTGEALTKTYCDILKRYHGAQEGVVAIDDAYCVEWAYIPHFYNAFYVYQYATSIAASALFAQKVSQAEPGALERYLALLRSGGSNYPYELVKTAGVDLSTPAPYKALVAQMNAIMDEIEALLAKRK